jgi:membrane associated rhomboid family serine protease
MSFFGSSRGVSLPPVVKNIIIINVILFVITWITTDYLNNDFMWRHFALYSVKSPFFEPHQLVTHIFMHANFGHIFFNMFGVYMFGRILEQLWGSKKMLIFYTVTGLGAAAIHLLVNYIQMNHLVNMVQQFNDHPSYLLFNEIATKYGKRTGFYSEMMQFMQQWFYKPDDMSFVDGAKQFLNAIVYGNPQNPVIGFGQLNTPTVGASGAVFGLLIAFAMVFPEAELMLIFLPIPIKAKYFVPIYALLELFFGVANFSWDNMAHFAHLGGALFGFLLVKWWKRNQFRIY